MQEHTLLGLSSEGFHRIYYREYGKQGKNNLIATHALTRNSTDFHFLGEELENEYHVFAPDLVGRGKSSRFINPSNYNFPQYLSDMALLIARTGVNELFWLGTSLGGLLGMILASLPCKCPPIKALILNDVGPVIPKVAIDRIDRYAGIKLVFKNLDEVRVKLHELYKPFGIENEKDWEFLIQNSIERQPDGTYTLSYDPKAAATLDDEASRAPKQTAKDDQGNLIYWNFWDRIKCPILVIQGGQSDILTSDIIEQMKKRGPKFDHILIENAGHAPALFSQSRIQLIQNWLSQMR